MSEIKTKTGSARTVILNNNGDFAWYQKGAYPLLTDGDTNVMTTDTSFDEQNSGQSGEFLAKDFQLNIPQKAKIKGVEVKMNLTKSGTSKDTKCTLSLFGIDSPTDKATNSALTTGYKTYGGDTELWGYDEITPDQLNSQDFGIVFSVYNNSSTTLDVGYLEVTVYYDNIYTEDDEVALEQDVQSEKQLFCKIYDKAYNYLNTLTLADLRDVPMFMYKADTGFGALTLNTIYTYEDYILGNGLVWVDGKERQSKTGVKKIKDILRCGNIIDIFISDRDGLNVHVYNGIIDGYTNSITGNKKEKLSVNITPNTTVLGARILRDGTKTLIDYNSEDPADMVRDILDRSNSFITYNSESVPSAVGVKRSYEFNASTVLDALKKVVELCPDWWIGFVDSNNLFHLKYMYEATEHIITENQISRIETEISMLDLRNTVYFLGGGDTPLFKKYEKSGSQNVYGVWEHKIADNRVTLEETAEQLSNRFLAQHQNPAIAIRVTLVDNNFTIDGNGVDIEKFEIGDKIKLVSDNYDDIGTEWGNFTWGETLWGYDIMKVYGRTAYITGYTYNYDSITLDCIFNPVQSQQRVEDINRDLKSLQYENAPSNYS